MTTGNNLLITLEDQLNELGLPNMAAELDRLYTAPGFLEMDHLTLISNLISPECLLHNKNTESCRPLL